MQSAAITFGIGIAAGNGVFVVCGAYGDLQISTNCIDWTDLGQVPFNKIIFEHGVFIASGYGGISVSTDGINWLSSDMTNSTYVDVAWGNGLFVAVGTTGIASEVFTSRNAINWRDTSSGTTSELVSVAHGNNVFVAVSDDGIILTSVDGSKWSQLATNTLIWPVLASSGDRPSEFLDPAGLGHDPANFRVSGEVDNQRGAFLLANSEARGARQEGFCLDYRHRTFHLRHYVTMVRYPRIHVKRMT